MHRKFEQTDPNIKLLSVKKEKSRMNIHKYASFSSKSELIKTELNEE